MKKWCWLVGLILLLPIGSRAEESQHIPIEGIVESSQKEELSISRGMPIDNKGKSELFDENEILSMKKFQEEYWEIRNKDVTEDVYKVEPIIGPKQYTLGEFNNKTLDNSTAYVNLIRKYSNMSPVNWTKERVEIAQHGAIVSSALRVLTHKLDQFEKPNAMSDEFWKQAVYATKYSNLGKMIYSNGDPNTLKSFSLNKMTDLYMYDAGVANTDVGHRTVILNPYYRSIGFGYAELRLPEERKAEFSAAMFAQGDGEVTVANDFIASWPLKQTFPIQYMNNDFRWSIHFYNQGYNFDRENLKVTLTNNQNGRKWDFSNKGSDGEYTVTNIWGYNSLVFMPENISYSEGDSFTVKIEGLTGEKSQYEYSTKLYDLNKEYVVEKIKGEFGTASWEWEEDTQTLVFGEGDFPNSGEPRKNIANIIENDSRLNGKKIKQIRFSKPVVAHKNSSHLFSNLKSLEKIEGLNHLDTSNVTTMESLFQNTSSLTTLDLSVWDTSKVTKMNHLFYANSSLTTLNLSGWNTSNVTTMQFMFFGNSSLKNLEVANWNTSKVTNMNYLFGRTSSLTSLDLTNWDTSEVTNMSSMFHENYSLISLNLSDWTTSKVTNMSSMFYGNRSLTNLNLSNWDTSKVTDMSSMFYDNHSLTSLDLSDWDTSMVTKMNYMFNTSNSLNSLNLSNWDTSKVTSMVGMFNNTSKLDTIHLGNKTLLHPNVGLGEKTSHPYTGKWVKTDSDSSSPVTYNSSLELITNYDGSQPGTYTREKETK